MVSVAWVPFWHELDPQLEVGQEDEFAFWREVPGHLRGPENYVLYCGLCHPSDIMFASGKIVAIRNRDLGVFRKINTRGLEYTMTMENGIELVVNAEEEPGKIYEGSPVAWVESKRIVSNWRFEVDFEMLSEPYCQSKYK